MPNIVVTEITKIKLLRELEIVSDICFGLVAFVILIRLFTASVTYGNALPFVSYGLYNVIKMNVQYDTIKKSAVCREKKKNNLIIPTSIL